MSLRSAISQDIELYTPILRIVQDKLVQSNQKNKFPIETTTISTSVT